MDFSSLILSIWKIPRASLHTLVLRYLGVLRLNLVGIKKKRLNEAKCFVFLTINGWASPMFSNSNNYSIGLHEAMDLTLISSLLGGSSYSMQYLTVIGTHLSNIVKLVCSCTYYSKIINTWAVSKVGCLSSIMQSQVLKFHYCLISSIGLGWD